MQAANCTLKEANPFNQKTPDTPKCIGSRIADESTIYCATSVATRLFNFFLRTISLASSVNEIVLFVYNFYLFYTQFIQFLEKRSQIVLKK